MAQLKDLAKKRKNSEVFAKIRLWFYCVALVHLAVVAIIMLNIDFRKAADPKVWFYEEIRFKLITAWFNLLGLVYFPISIYCEWRKINSQEHWPHVNLLNQIRFTCFTSILFPTTSFADTLFWRLWYKDRELIAPATVDEVAPFWTQHCMHTVSLVVVVLDLMLMPRKKPKDIRLGLTIMHLFIGAYISLCVYSIFRGQYIYPVFKTLSNQKLCILILYVILEHYFYYTLQWFIVDLIWGTENCTNIKIKSVLSNFFPVLSDLVLNRNTLIPILRFNKVIDTQSIIGLISGGVEQTQ